MDAQEFQKAQKAKLLACYGETPESVIAKAQENDLEKGGEGSRGGKIIGHTRSGKPIYDNPHHPSHKSFSKEDHLDAVYEHMRPNFDLSKLNSEGRFNDPKYLAAYDKAQVHRKEVAKIERKEKYSHLKDDNKESRDKTFEKLVKRRKRNTEDIVLYDDLYDHIAANHGEKAAEHFTHTFDPDEDSVKQAHEALRNATNGKHKVPWERK